MNSILLFLFLFAFCLADLTPHLTQRFTAGNQPARVLIWSAHHNLTLRHYPRPDHRLDFLLKAARPVVWQDHGPQSP